MANGTMTQKGRVIHSGMGGFLNPPGHPEHTHSVETDLRRRPWNRSRMSLSAAVACEWLDTSTREAADWFLKSWQPLPIDHPDVVAWVRRVLGYFRSCYRNANLAEPECWYAGQVTIDPNRDPLEEPADHCGVHLIRQYYPQYEPTAEDFAHARWGS
jgi:hypothetical protein